MKIELGQSKKKKDWITIDKRGNPDHLLDLEKTKLPFKDNSVDEIRAWHLLEHISNFFELMNECHRILKSDGLFKIQVPMYPSIDAFTDPTHIRYFTEHTFLHLTKEHGVGMLYGFKPWTIIEKDTSNFLTITLQPYKK